MVKNIGFVTLTLYEITYEVYHGMIRLEIVILHSDAFETQEH